jgi:glycogen synthase
VPVYLRTLYASHPSLGGLPSVTTIHNLAYQGVFTPDWLPRLDLGWELFTVDRLEYWDHISFLKGGIMAADLITTVSPRYAEEIQTRELGFGFDGILAARRPDLVGILNGIDIRDWDPAHDSHLPCPYDADDLAGKKDAKRALLRRLRLPDDAAAMKRPVVGMVSRMVDQKGFDLIAALAGELSRLDATFAVLGTGEARYQDMWTSLAAQHPDRIAVEVRAVRAQPDVQHALRHGAGRACRRRAGGHGARLRAGRRQSGTAARETDGLCLPRIFTRGAARGADARGRAVRRRAKMARAPGCRHAAGFFMGPIGARVRQTI